MAILILDRYGQWQQTFFFVFFLGSLQSQGESVDSFILIGVYVFNMRKEAYQNPVDGRELGILNLSYLYKLENEPSEPEQSIHLNIVNFCRRRHRVLD